MKVRQHTRDRVSEAIHNKKILTIVVAATVLLLAFYVIVLVNKQSSDLPEQVDITVQIAGALQSDASTEQKDALLQTILAIPGYKDDANMLYFVVLQYIRLGDASKARQALDELMLVYDAKLGLDKGFGNTIAITDLIASVESLEKRVQTLKDYAKSGLPAE